MLSMLLKWALRRMRLPAYIGRSICCACQPSRKRYVLVGMSSSTMAAPFSDMPVATTFVPVGSNDGVCSMIFPGEEKRARRAPVSVSSNTRLTLLLSSMCTTATREPSGCSVGEKYLLFLVSCRYVFLWRLYRLITLYVRLP